MDGLTEGRIVHYITASGEQRAAIVVKVWDALQGVVDLSVFLTQGDYLPGPAQSHGEAVIMLETSVVFGTGPGTWHWIERV